MVTTLSSLPEIYSSDIGVTLNDKEFHVVARNAILLLFIFTALDEVTAKSSAGSKIARSLIHLWYSASITSEIYSELVSRVKPLFDDVCRQISATPAQEIVEKVWLFPHGKNLRLALKSEDWFSLQALCDVPSTLTSQKALEARKAITLAPERRDYRDRWYFKDATPSVRVAKQRFREDGLLLPVGDDRLGFGIPNP